MEYRTEVWKDIVGYEGLYQVSSFGRVKSLDKLIKGKSGSLVPRKEKALRLDIDVDGYLIATLTKDNNSKKYKVHRLVAMNFIPNSFKKSQVNHIDNVRNNNKVSNLKWGTPSENSKHMRMCDRQAKGDKIGNSKLNEEKVTKIRDLISKKIPYKAIAKKFSVYPGTIQKIRSRTTWKHIK